MSGRKSREKGRRAELTLVHRLQDAGLAAEKSSRTGYAGSDISVPLLGRDLKCECKVRGTGFKQIYTWLEGADLLIVRADRSQPLVVIPFRLAIEIAKAAENSNSRMRVSSAPDAVISGGAS
jgi:hypothetical protein